MLGDGVAAASASLVLIVTVLAVAGAAQADEVEDPTGTACVGVDEAAECGQLALAHGGDATCTGEPVTVGPIEAAILIAPECAAVTDTGDAACGADACIVTAIDGNATCQGVLCTAVAGTGDADGAWAVAGDGNASGTIVLAGTGDATASWLAVSGTGDADAMVLGFAAVTGTGDASADYVGLVAASGTGDAEASGLGVLAASGTGDATSAILAVGATGNATASYLLAASATGGTAAPYEVNGMNDADGCVAVSGTGSARSSCHNDHLNRSYAVSGCDTGREANRSAACRGPEQRRQVHDVATCDVDLATEADGQAHAWCATRTGACIQVVWGAAIGPAFVGGDDGCQAGAFYDEDGHDRGSLA